MLDSFTKIAKDLRRQHLAADRTGWLRFQIVVSILWMCVFAYAKFAWGWSWFELFFLALIMASIA